MVFKFQWTEELSVGDPLLDKQHQHLLSKINALIDAIFESEDTVSVYEIIRFLDSYVNEHFRDEEDYMFTHGYPKLDEHRLLHEAFIIQYRNLKQKIFTEKPSELSLVEMENILAKWWINHIGQEDKKYADFVAEKRSLEGKKLL